MFFEDPFCTKMDAANGEVEVQSHHNGILDNLPIACDLLKRPVPFISHLKYEDVCCLKF